MRKVLRKAGFQGASSCERIIESMGVPSFSHLWERVASRSEVG